MTNVAFIGFGKLGKPCAEVIAQKGHDVTAIDFAKKPIARLKKESEQHDLRVNLIQKDI